MKDPSPHATIPASLAPYMSTQFISPIAAASGSVARIVTLRQ